MAFSSYAGSFGSLNVNGIAAYHQDCIVPQEIMAQSDGLFIDKICSSLSSIPGGASPGGASHTLMVTEKSTSGLRSLVVTNSPVFDSSCWYVEGNMNAALFTTMYPPNLKSKLTGAQEEVLSFGALSSHSGGLNVLFADISVSFVKDSINSWTLDQLTGLPLGSTITPGGYYLNLPTSGVWQQLSTRSGGEIVNDEKIP